MPTNKTRMLPAAVIEADRAALVALRTLTDYAPNNPNTTIAHLNLLEKNLREAEDKDLLARNTQEAAGAALIFAEWELHDAMLSAKAVVLGQYGPDSDAIQSLGLKKKSEYRRPTRRPKVQKTT